MPSKMINGLNYHPPRTATYVVAASDAPAHVKAQADYVCDGTADQVQIQAAIDALPANGGNVLLLGGSYDITASIELSSNHKLQGSIGTRLELSAQVHVITNSDPVGGNTNIVVESIEIDGNGIGLGQIGMAIMFDNVSYVEIRNNIIHDTWIDGIRLRNVSNSRVVDNFLYDIGNVDGTGIGISYASYNIEVSGNIINGSVLEAIEVDSVGKLITISNNVVSDNANSIRYRIEADDGTEQITISNNVVYCSYFGGIRAGTTRSVVIDSNVIHMLGAAYGSVYGIEVGTANGAIVSNNIVKWYSSREVTGGIIVFSSYDVLIQGNLLNGSYNPTNSQGIMVGTEGILFTKGPTRIVIDSNIITGFGIGISLGGSATALSADFLVTNNKITYASGPGIWTGKVTNGRFSGNVVVGNSYTSGIEVTRAVNSVFEGNICKPDYRAGLFSTLVADAPTGQNFVRITEGDRDLFPPGIFVTLSDGGNSENLVVDYMNLDSATPAYLYFTTNLVNSYTVGAGAIVTVRNLQTYGIHSRNTASGNRYQDNILAGVTGPILLEESGYTLWGNYGYIAPSEVRTASGSLTKTDYTFTTVTGTFTETGTQLLPGANTLHCTVNGTAKIDIPTGCVAIAASVGGGATVADSPKTLVHDTAFAVTAGGTNEFTITITHIGFAWHDPELQDIFIKKVVVNITTKGGTATATMDIGIADDAIGTNLGAEFFNDIDVDAAAAVHDSYVVGDGGAQTKWVLCQDSVSATDGWIVGKIITEKADGLVGSYYIEYVGK